MKKSTIRSKILDLVTALFATSYASTWPTKDLKKEPFGETFFGPPKHDGRTVLLRDAHT